MKFLGIRLSETLGFEIVLSVLCSVLFYFDVLEQSVKVCTIVMFLCIVINVGRLFRNLKGYYLFSGVRKRMYYKTNLAVVSVITILTMVFAGFNIEPLFTWLFFPFKILNILFGAPKMVSALALNAIFAAVTVCIPVFVRRRRH